MDTTGLLIKAHVHPANQNDREGARCLLSRPAERLRRLQVLWVDQGYSGAPFVTWMQGAFPGCEVRVTTRQHPHTWIGADDGKVELSRPDFEILPRRWVVERTFAWLGRNRRLSKDYEGLPETEEALIYMAMVNLMLRRIA